MIVPLDATGGRVAAVLHGTTLLLQQLLGVPVNPFGLKKANYSIMVNIFGLDKENVYPFFTKGSATGVTIASIEHLYTPMNLL